MRTLPAGERLRSSGVYQGDRGMFYRVETEEGYGFVPAVSVMVESPDREDMLVEGLQLPKSMEPGSAPQVAGTVSTRLCKLSSLELCIYNDEDKRVARNRMVCKDDSASIEVLAGNQIFTKLPEGSYRVEVIAHRDYFLAQGTEIIYERLSDTIYENMLVVGKASGSVSYIMAEPERNPDNGWFRKDGEWFCYENGQPKTGWVTILNTKYYLDETGAALTGWRYLNNSLWYFGDDGALRTNQERTYGKNIYQIGDTGIAVFKAEVQPPKKKK